MKINVIICLLLSTISAFAEDIIVLNNGNIIKAIVLDISNAEISYKKVSNPNGPTYHIDIVDVMSINYENGEKDMFEKQQSVLNGRMHNTQYIESIPSVENEALVALYNKSTLRHKKRAPNKSKVKLTDIAVVNFGVTPNSIMSDNNIKVSLELNDIWYETKDGRWGNPKYLGDACYKYNYKIYIYNKTDKILYIDVANSFRILYGEAESFYNGIDVSNSSEKSSVTGLNFGAITNALGIGGIVGSLASGVSMEGGKGISTSIIEHEDLILSIPPHAKVAMPAKVYMSEKKDCSAKNYEVFCDYAINYPKVEKWAYTDLGDRLLNETKSYVITYSTSKQFDTYTSITFGIYPRGLLGITEPDLRTNYEDFMTVDGPVLKNNFSKLYLEQ